MKENKKKFETKTILPIFKTFLKVPDSSKPIKHISKKFIIPEKTTYLQRKRDIKFLTKKSPYFKVENYSRHRRKNLENLDSKDGRWTKDERIKFFHGIALYGANWKKVKSLISTRTAIQVRSHAQKFFIKMKLCKDEQLGIDFTLKSICSIKDMISQIRSINSNYSLEYIFKYLSEERDRKRKLKKQNKNTPIQNMPIINEKRTINLEDDERNNKNNNTIMDNLNKNKEIDSLEKTREKSMPEEQIIKNINTNFIPPNNDIQFNDINNINNNLNHIILNKNNTFLNDNNNINFFENTLNNIVQLNNIYNNFLSNTYINYNNNTNDGFLLRNLLINSTNIPFLNVFSMFNLFNLLKNQK